MAERRPGGGPPATPANAPTGFDRAAAPDADGDAVPGSVGGGQVLLVAGTAAAVVLAAALVTALLPPEVRTVVLDAPLVIAVLIVVTGIVLWRAARR